MSPKLPVPSQSQPEVWLVLDGVRVLGRLRAAGPSWLHVFIDGAPPARPQIPFTVVLRGAEGGVVDGLSVLMSSARRDGRTVLHLRLIHVSTSGRHRLIKRFVRDVLRSGDDSAGCFADDQALRAIHRRHRTAPETRQVSPASDGVRVSKPATWRSGSATTQARIIQSTASGRRLVVRRSGPPPSTWETVHLEVDLGAAGEPRPVTLVGMVIGALPTGRSGSSDVVIRLARWSRDADRVAWMRWVRHQSRVDSAATGSGASPATRTAPRPHRLGVAT